MYTVPVRKMQRRWRRAFEEIERPARAIPAAAPHGRGAPPPKILPAMLRGLGRAAAAALFGGTRSRGR